MQRYGIQDSINIGRRFSILLRDSTRRRRKLFCCYLDAADLFAGCLAHPYNHSIEDIPAIVEAARADVAALVETIAARLPSATVFLNTLFYADLGGTYHGLEYNSGFSFRQIIASYNAACVSLHATLPMWWLWMLKPW